jgi:O-antigen ligase
MAVNTPVPRSAVVGSLVAGMVLQAAIALPQFALGHSLGLEVLGELQLGGGSVGASVVADGDQRWLRAYGLTIHPNLLGGYLMIGMLVVSGYCAGSVGRRRVPLLLAVDLGLAALLVTFSRSAWIGTALGGLAMAAMSRETPRLNWRALIGPAAVALVVGSVFLLAEWQLLVPRLGLTGEETEVRSVEERQLLNDAALIMIQRRPMPGVGLANFSAAVPLLVPESPLGPPVRPVHNVPLLAAAELGLPAGLLWLFMMAAPWIALWTVRERIHVTPWLAGLSGAVAALTVAALVDYYVWASHSGSVIQWLVWGLWAREWQRTIDAAPSRSVEISPRIPRC